MAIKPIGERVLLKPVKREEMTKGGIYIPESNDDSKKEGIIDAIGVDHKDLQVGDTVLYGGYSNEEFERDGTKYVIVEIKDVVAKID